MSKKRNRRTLTLADRVEVIQASTANTETNYQLSKKFKCSLTQIRNIIRRKDEYLHEWENNGNLLHVSKKQSACFLTVGAVVCEFAHRWLRKGFDLREDILCGKGKLAANLLHTTEIRTTKYWLDRLTLRFRIDDPLELDCNIKKSVKIEDIIRDLMPSYDPESKFPQVLDFNVIKPYLKDPAAVRLYHEEGEEEEEEAGEIESIDGIDVIGNLVNSSTTEPNFNPYYEGADERLSDGEISIIEFMDAKIEDDCSVISDDTEPRSPAKSINSYKQALRYLGPLEEFVLMQEDVRATGLIEQLENLFKDKLKNLV